MKRILNFCFALVPALIMTAIAYLFIAFIHLDIDFRHWGETSRVILCILCCVLWALGYSLMGVKEFWDSEYKKDTEKQK